MSLPRTLLVFLAVNLVSFAVFMLLHVLLYWSGVLHGLGPGIIVAAVASATAGAALVYAAMRRSGATVLPVVFASALGFIGYCGIYIILFPVSLDRSLSVHMMELLAAAPAGALSEQELIQAYPREKIYEKRFQDLERGGLISRGNGTITITAKGRVAADLFRRMNGVYRFEMPQ